MRKLNEIFWPIARKSHRCVWCFQQIEVGEQYAHYIGIWNGEFQDWRMHEECHEDYDINDYGRDGFTPGSYPRPEKKATHGK